MQIILSFNPFLPVELSIFIVWRYSFLVLGVSGERLHFYCTVAYLSTFRNFHRGDSAQINIFDPFFLQLSVLGKSLGISMGETFFLLTSRLRHNNKKHSFQELLTV